MSFRDRLQPAEDDDYEDDGEPDGPDREVLGGHLARLDTHVRSALGHIQSARKVHEVIADDLDDPVLGGDTDPGNDLVDGLNVAARELRGIRRILLERATVGQLTENDG